MDQYIRALVVMTGVLGSSLLATGCASKFEAQKELAAQPPLEQRQSPGTLDALSTCLSRSGADISLTREGSVLYVVPRSTVAETKIIQIESGQLSIEHRAGGRTLGGSPLGWEYLEMVVKCASGSS